jgi:chaperonin GroES
MKCVYKAPTISGEDIMGRKDILAAGGRKMTIAGGIGDGDIFRNVAPEGTRDESTPTVEPTKIVRKKFVPRESVVLVRPKPADVVNSLIITEGTVEQERPAEGFVVERGPKVDYSIGTHVVYGKYSGTEFKLNGETLLLMNLSDILGSVTDEFEDLGDQYFSSNLIAKNIASA